MWIRPLGFRQLAFALILLLIGAGIGFAPAGYDKLQSSMTQRSFDQAGATFEEQYPDASLVTIGRATDTWIYTYTLGGESFAVLRIGQDWLTIDLQGE